MPEGPYTLTDEKRALLMEAAGAPWPIQAAYAGVPVRTFRRWRAKAREGEEPYASLMVEMGIKRASRTMRWEAMIEKIGEGEYDEGEKRWIRQPNWTAIAWLLERNYPHLYGMVEKLRQDVAEEAATTSMESRLAVLQQAFETAVPQEAGDGG